MNPNIEAIKIACLRFKILKDIQDIRKRQKTAKEEHQECLHLLLDYFYKQLVSLRKREENL